MAVPNLIPFSFCRKEPHLTSTKIKAIRNHSCLDDCYLHRRIRVRHEQEGFISACMNSVTANTKTARSEPPREILGLRRGSESVFVSLLCRNADDNMQLLGKSMLLIGAEEYWKNAHMIAAACKAMAQPIAIIEWWASWVHQRFVLSPHYSDVDCHATRNIKNQEELL